MRLETRILNSTAKVFLDAAPEAVPGQFSGLKDEVISFQVAWRLTEDSGANDTAVLCLATGGNAAKYARFRYVRQVPVGLATYPDADKNYLRDARPGLYPDILAEIPPHGLRARRGRWECMWVDFVLPADAEAGDYRLEINLSNEDTGEILGSERATLSVIDAQLPPQSLVHTKWLHTDCLATYYHVEIFSEEYWRIVENFVALAVKRGINMILTPVHTPPLDTRIGMERPTVQLVDVCVQADGTYRFGFEKLDRWVQMCRNCGVAYYEIAHLFTQWGAKHAPKIIANTPEGTRRIFGWDTCATGAEYTDFLAQYLPALTEELRRLGIADKCVFHVSDEPNKDNLADYLAAKAVVAPYLKDFPIMDALSDIAFYNSGAVEHPVVSINHIEPFLDQDVPGLWGYYCCGQYKDMSNVFIAMPGARTRALGAQLFKFDLAGFLQWGYNFYYAQRSDYPINPWLETDAGGAFPSGDAFQVYPGEGGVPVDSLRSMLFLEAMQDLRAMRLLETLAGRQAVLDLIDEDLDAPLRFAACPYTDEYVIGLREKVNREIRRRVEK